MVCPNFWLVLYVLYKITVTKNHSYLPVNCCHVITVNFTVSFFQCSVKILIGAAFSTRVLHFLCIVVSGSAPYFTLYICSVKLLKVVFPKVRLDVRKEFEKLFLRSLYLFEWHSIFSHCLWRKPQLPGVRAHSLYRWCKVVLLPVCYDG